MRTDSVVRMQRSEVPSYLTTTLPMTKDSVEAMSLPKGD